MIADKLGSMNRTLVKLDEKYNRLLFSYAIGPIGPSVRQAQEVSYNAIQTLRGLHVRAGEINPWDRAIESDEYLLSAWLPLAQQTEDNMNMALGYADAYSVTTLFVDTVTGAAAVIGKKLPSADQATASLGFIAIAAVAIAVIVVMK